MTGPEASEKFDHWVEQCRQQLERGAASNALADWMKAEGVKPAAIDAILQAAKEEPADGNVADTAPESAAPEQEPAPAVAPAPAPTVTAAPAPPQQPVPAVNVAPAPPSPPVPEVATAQPQSGDAPAGGVASVPAQPPHVAPQDAAAVFAHAFGKSRHKADGETAEPQPEAPQQAVPGAIAPVQPAAPEVATQVQPIPAPAPIPAMQPAPAAALPQPFESPAPVPAPAPAVPTNLFGTPHPPGEMPPMPVPPDPVLRETGEPAESAAGSILDSGTLWTPGEDGGAADPAAAEEIPEPAVLGAEEPEPDLTADPPPPEEEQLESLDGDSEAGVPDEEAEPDRASDVSGYREEALRSRDVEGIEGIEGIEDVESVDDIEEAHQYADSLADAANRMGMSISDPLREDPEESYEDFVQRERPVEPDPEGESEGEPPAPSRKRIIEPHGSARPKSSGPADAGGSELERMIREAEQAAAQSEPKPLRAGDEPNSGGPADGGGSELARMIREAEQAAEGKPEPLRASREESIGGGEDDPLPDRPESISLKIPRTDEELARAAKELRISFRDDGAPDPIESDDDMARTARELGISFRDDGGPALPEPDDETAKAARELGIDFRAEDTPKPKKGSAQKSTLRRYWPVLLLMALAAAGMPMVVAYLMFMAE